MKKESVTMKTLPSKLRFISEPIDNEYKHFAVHVKYIVNPKDRITHHKRTGTIVYGTIIRIGANVADVVWDNPDEVGGIKTSFRVPLKLLLKV